MEQSIAILAAAHFLGDFFLQPQWLVGKKTRFSFLLLHGTIHAALVYALYQAWGCWELPLAVFVTHTSIDFVKQKWTSDSAGAFAWDQAAHALSLLGIAWYLTGTDSVPVFQGHGYALIVSIGGFVATVHGAGYYIEKVAGMIKQRNALEIDGLENGGAWIGKLERVLIFLFIFIDQPEGIGFLVAAKSILRFEEARKQKLAEYVLIGTLLSFSLAIGIAAATHWAVGL
ncbi:MAG: DUF3307 domain-containing protein [Bacteroidota bacterium]|nr:DUF3307 domain-containing protein [Bacteroidota bacterium]